MRRTSKDFASLRGDFGENEERKLIISGGSPKREREYERVNLVLLPEGQFLISMLRGFAKDMVLDAERRCPRIVRLLSNPYGEFAVARRSGSEVRGMDVAAPATDYAGERADPFQMSACPLARPAVS